MLSGIPGILYLSLLCLQSFTIAQTTREQFASLASSHGGIIKLNSKTFDAITDANRDWSVSVQMTAIAGHQVKCEPCLQFAPSYDAVGKAWKKVPKSQRDYHFFATLDFKDGADIFKRMGISTAPFVHFYPATKGPLVQAHPHTNMWAYDFNQNSFDAKIFAEQFSKHTPVPIPYTPPFNWAVLFSVMTAFACLFVAYTIFGSAILAAITSRWIWGIASLGFIIYMLSGAMFVRIRLAPFAGQVRGPNGQPVLSYIAGGYQNQFGAEVQIMSGLYTLLAASQIALIVYAPRLPSHARQRVAVFIWIAVSWMLFSVQIAVFKIKHGAYPFKLLLG